jgi:hypothetical protein
MSICGRIHKLDVTGLAASANVCVTLRDYNAGGEVFSAEISLGESVEPSQTVVHSWYRTIKRVNVAEIICNEVRKAVTQARVKYAKTNRVSDLPVYTLM